MNFMWPVGMLPPAIPGTTSPAGKIPQVNTEHPSYMKMLQRWRVVDDCCQGEEIIKFKGELYLPRPNPDDKSTENMDRYRCYKQRAVFYNVTKRTLRGLTGEVFVIDPVPYVPEPMKNILCDVNGSGLTIVQQAKEALDDTLKFGRLGLFVDFPKTAGGVSRADILSGAYKPMIFKISPIDILNWRAKLIGGRMLTTLVVFRERYIVDDDTFARSEAEQYRVLRLGHSIGGVVDYIADEDSVYINEVWRPDGKGGFAKVGDSTTPVDADGNMFKELPFFIVGSDNNEIEPCEPPLYDIAILNIAHYRNSADYEESAYICGQPMLWYSGITKAWQDSVFKNQRVNFGSRSGLPLPPHGTAGILQAKENTLPMEAMKHKEAQMVAIGAKLVEVGGTVKTATQDYQEKVEESNVLASCAKNVSEGYSQALRFASRFIDTSLVSKFEISYKLNTDFSTSRMTAQERLQLMKEWQGGVMAWDEVRFRLHRAGIAFMDDKEAKAAIKTEEPERQVAFQTIVADTRMDRGGSTGGGQ